MTRFQLVILATVSTSLGCADSAGWEAIATDQQAVKEFNGKEFNGLILDAADIQSQGNSTLAGTLRSANEWNYNEVAYLQDSADGRLTIKFMVKCALPSTESIVAEDASSNEYTYTGNFNLAPGWKTGSLSAAEKGKISACMLAFVNETNTSVEVSARMLGDTPATPDISADATEMSDFPVYEGGFYGDLFSGDVSGKSFACQGDAQDVGIALSDDRELRRYCADDTTTNGGQCDITVVGKCRDVCTEYTPGYGWQNCTGGGTTYASVTSAFLPADNTDVEEYGCTGTCTIENTASAAAALLDCEGALNCTATCDGTLCSINGDDATTVNATIENGATGDVKCSGGTCTVTTTDTAVAEIDCEGGNCTVACDSGNCALDCTGATTCTFSSCSATGGAETCTNGDYKVCGVPCPLD